MKYTTESRGEEGKTKLSDDAFAIVEALERLTVAVRNS